RSQTSFERRSTVRTWLITILRRRACDLGRRRRRLEPLDEGTFDAAPDGDSLEAIDRYHASDEARRVLDLLDQLSAREREAILLCDVQDLERDEAAARLHLTRPHLRVVLHRGRNKLLCGLGSDLAVAQAR